MVKIPAPMVDLSEGGRQPIPRNNWPIRCSGPSSPWCTRPGATPRSLGSWPRPGERRSAADLRRPDGWSSYQQGLDLFRAAAAGPLRSRRGTEGRGRGVPPVRGHRGPGALAFHRIPRRDAAGLSGHLGQAVDDHTRRGRRGQRDPWSHQCRDAEPHSGPTLLWLHVGRPVAIPGVVRDGAGRRRGDRVPDAR